MAKVDFSLDSVDMEQYKNDLRTLQSMLIDVSDSIDSIQQSLVDENLVKWHGNGKEQCTAFVTLIDRLTSLIAGEPKSGIAGIIKDPLGSDIISEGTNWEHFTMMDKSIEKLLYEAGKFSFMAQNEKAKCIAKLENLNFKEG